MNTKKLIGIYTLVNLSIALVIGILTYVLDIYVGKAKGMIIPLLCSMIVIYQFIKNYKRIPTKIEANTLGFLSALSNLLVSCSVTIIISFVMYGLEAPSVIYTELVSMPLLFILGVTLIISFVQYGLLFLTYAYAPRIIFKQYLEQE